MENTGSEIFGNAFASCLTDLDGLGAVFLPEGVEASIAESIARSANRQRPVAPPFAIIISPKQDLSDPECLRMSSQAAIAYRSDSRLAIVLGLNPDLASFRQAYRDLVGPSYPAGATNKLSLARLATNALKFVVESAGLAPSAIWDRNDAESLLGTCFRQLMEAYEQVGQGSREWNAYWFEHVSIGLSQLSDLIRRKLQSDPGITYRDLFAQYTYPSFGLPTPEDGVALRPGKAAGKLIAAALSTWWADGATINSTVQQLAHHPDTPHEESHALSRIDWSGFDEMRARNGNDLLAMVQFILAGDTRTLEAYTSLTERQFFDPLDAASKTRFLAIYGSGEEDLTAGASANLGPFILLSSADETLPAVAALRSQEVRILVAMMARPTAEQVIASKLRVVATAPKLTWQGETTLGPDGNVWAIGRFVRNLGTNSVSRPIVTSRIKVEVDANDSLAGMVDTAVSCDLIMLPPTGNGMFFMRSTNNGLGKPTFMGADEFDLLSGPRFEDARFSETLTGLKSVQRIILWSTSSRDSVRFESKPVPPLKSRDGLFTMSLVPQASNEFAIGDFSYELVAPIEAGLFRSPIVAAIKKQLISASPPSNDTAMSLQGRYETIIAAKIQSEHWLDALGHVVIPENQRFDFDAVSLDSSGVLMDPATSNMKASTDFTVPNKLLDSVEVSEFRAAVVALGLAEALDVTTTDGEKQEWPSRTSWRSLWEGNRGALDNYLTAYSNLVQCAKKIGNSHGVFWATYPFGMSVWDSASGLCRAVLLSPLHPLRLAWLAGVESTLWDADDAALLAGTVEGWNFPVVGPSETENGRLIAVPTDSGDGQVFLGWSMLVQVSINGFQALDSPVMVGGAPAPGNALSGLNSTAAAAALRSYRSMHPHVSTLTIDLAASSPMSRLQEVDGAVLTAVKMWSGSTSGRLLGGVRVWDSIHRSGSAPADEVAQLAQGIPSVPFSWTRYLHRPGEASKTCNIRLLQDSGVKLEAGHSNEPNLGLLGQAALRRFEAHEPPNVNVGYAESRPSLAEGVGWPPFSKALGHAEGSAENPRIRSKLLQAALVDESADWTVSGEGLMGPSAMAGLIENSGSGKQMLWEWRPPFLEASEGVPTLERRPFVSVARVPGSFRSQLKSLLSKAEGSEASDEAVGKLLGKLGARGVGLSSLLSMGGTHAAGALGFYLAFSLMDSIDAAGADQFVIPIDASDSFLRALAGGTQPADSIRRADLLVIRVDDEAVTLVPIEIKLYGLLAAPGSNHLPSPGDSKLREALDQLSSTKALLLRVASRSLAMHLGESHADRRLWDNALATLIEAGSRLQPPESKLSGNFHARLQRVIDGRLPIRIGKPVLTFFQHNSNVEAGESFTTHVRQEDADAGSYGALISDAGEAFRAVETPDHSMLAQWSRVIEWAVTPDPDYAGASVVAPISFDDGTGRAELRELTLTEPGRLSASSTPAQRSPIEVDAEPEATSIEDVDEGLAEEAEAVVEDASLPASPISDLRPEPTTTPSDSQADEQIVEPAELAVGVKFSVGTLLDSIGQASAEFWPGNTALNQMNIGVVGDLGTGKTELLKAVIAGLRSRVKATQVNPLSMLVLDYKRDYQEDSFVDRVGAKVLLPNKIPLNVFALTGEYSKLAAFQKGQEIADVIAKIYGNVGPVQRSRIARLTAELFAGRDGHPPTLAMLAEAYRAEVSDDSVTAILDIFVYGEVFSDDPDELMDFDELIRDKVLVVAIDRLGVDQKTKNAVVVLFLNMYYGYMIRARKFPFAGTDPQIRQLSSFLLVDEATNIMEYEFPVLMSLMLQGRQFGFGTVLASQYLSHFKTSTQNYGQPLLTWFIHKVPNVTESELNRLGITGLPLGAAGRIQSLKTHQALYKSYGYDGSFIRGTPFYELADSDS